MDRKKNRCGLVCLLIILTICAGARAQTISAGIVNGKALSLTKPDYPPDAGKIGSTVTVKVKVTIDESGNVISAEAISGGENVAFKRAAEAAALNSKFSPTIFSGKPVKVTGTIVYNFAANISNRERIKVLGVSVFLTLLRDSVKDSAAMKSFFNSDDLVKDSIAEFSDFYNELAPLAEFGKIAPENRLRKIDEAAAAVRVKLNPAQKWQFELGEPFANVILSLAHARTEDQNGKSFDSSRLDENSLKQNLLKIEKLCATASPDFPADVLARLKDLAAFGNKETILAPDVFKDFTAKVNALFETLAPDSGN